MVTQTSPESPRVSIITATYNYSSVLKYAIASALAQTLRSFEYLVIGDGCTDDTADVVAGFRDPRLCFHNLPSNSGSQSAPNNKGLELARGEYVAYLGHDDLWTPDHLEKLVRALDVSGGDWAHPLAVLLGPPGSNVRVPVGLVEPGTDPERANFITSGVVHRRTLVDAVGNWRDYRTLDIAPDREFHARVIQSGAQLVHVDNLSVFKFPSAWRKNVYRDQPCREQASYLERMCSEPDFIQTELLAIVWAQEFKTWEKWIAKAELPADPPPTAPRGAQIESWRRFRGLPSNALTPRAWYEVLWLRARGFAAEQSRPLRDMLRRVQ